uniref:Uncharacterized protein n=1 Tax=Fagus sylvatica TaxID=28930 RepID=A0A2N9F9H4_FAGSY
MSEKTKGLKPNSHTSNQQGNRIGWLDDKSSIWKKTPNPLSSEHPRPLEITPPTVRLNLTVKKEVPHQSHEPPQGSGKAHLNMTGTEEKERKRNQREQKGGGGGSTGSDQDRTKGKEKGERGGGWATRRDLTIPATISLTRR